MAHGRSIDIKELDNGYMATIYYPSGQGELYTDPVQLIGDKDAMIGYLGQFLNKEEIKAKDEEEIMLKREPRTLLSD